MSSIFGSFFSQNDSCSILWFVLFLMLISLFIWVFTLFHELLFFPLHLSFFKLVLSTTPRVIFCNTNLILNFPRLSFQWLPIVHNEVKALYDLALSGVFPIRLYPNSPEPSIQPSELPADSPVQTALLQCLFFMMVWRFPSMGGSHCHFRKAVLMALESDSSMVFP